LSQLSYCPSRRGVTQGSALDLSQSQAHACAPTKDNSSRVRGQIKRAVKLAHSRELRLGSRKRPVFSLPRLGFVAPALPAFAHLAAGEHFELGGVREHPLEQFVDGLGFLRVLAAD